MATERLPSVVITPGTDTQVQTSQAVSMSVFGHPKALIYYTSDGSNPRVSGVRYLNPFFVIPETILRAYAKEDGFKDSFETTAYYPYVKPSTPVVSVTNANIMDEYPKEVVVAGLFSVFSRGSSGWKYAKGTVNYPSASGWYSSLVYDDSLWINGSNAFWYGSPVQVGTQLSDMQNNYTTVYLRKKFTVSNASLVSRLRFDVSIDDGYIIWVNGVEVSRYNAPAGAFPLNTDVAASSSKVASYVDEVDNPGLINGENLIAAMLFNRSLGSTDIWFDLDFQFLTIVNGTYVSFNGSAPEPHTGPMSVTGPGTLLAYVVGQNGLVSPPISRAFTQQLPCPEFSTVAGKRTAPTAVFMSVPGFDPADIYYSVDGTTPSLKYDPAYPPFFSDRTDIRAFARKDGYVDSSVTRWKLPLGDETYVVGLIGDQGDGRVAEPRPYIAVAQALRAKNPNFIFGVGDNTYTTGLPTDKIIQMDILDGYSPEVLAKTFFTAWGNHDWYPVGGGGDGATLPELLKVFNYQPGNKRYFDLVVGHTHFFFLSTYSPEPDLGYVDPNDAVATYNSKQGRWFRAKADASTCPWKIVIFHHVPYTSETNYRPGIRYMRWPFENHGIDMVFCGHMHAYERLIGEDGVYYFGIGNGGKEPLNHGLVWTPPGLQISGGDGATTQVFNMTSYGAATLKFSAHQMLVETFSDTGVVLDSLTLTK